MGGGGWREQGGWGKGEAGRRVMTGRKRGSEGGRMMDGMVGERWQRGRGAGEGGGRGRREKGKEHIWRDGCWTESGGAKNQEVGGKRGKGGKEGKMPSICFYSFREVDFEISWK